VSREFVLAASAAEVMAPSANAENSAIVLTVVSLMSCFP